MGGFRQLKHADIIVAIALITAAVCVEAAPQGEVGATMTCPPDADENVSPADAIQACIDRAPAFSIVEIPAGTYVLNHQIEVSTPLTLRTATATGNASCIAVPEGCAVLVAPADFTDQWGLLVVRSRQRHRRVAQRW